MASALNGHEFEEAQRVGDGQGGLACHSPWDCKESDTTRWLNKTELIGHTQPGSSVHGILQARILEWVAMPFSRGSSQLRDWNHFSYVSCIDWLFTTESPGSVFKNPAFFILSIWNKKPYGLPWWLRWWRIHLQWRRPGFNLWRRSPGGGNGNPLQYSSLENPMDREAW